MQAPAQQDAAQQHQQTVDQFISALARLGNAEVNVAYSYVRIYIDGILLNPRADVYVSFGGRRISMLDYVQQQEATALFDQLRKGPSGSSFSKALQFWSPVLLPNCREGSVPTVIAKIAGEVTAILALEKACLHDPAMALFSKPGERHLIPKRILMDFLRQMKHTDLREVYSSCHKGQGGKGEHAVLMDRLLDMPSPLSLPAVAKVVDAARTEKGQGRQLTGKAFRDIMKTTYPDAFKVWTLERQPTQQMTT